jgi:hypothetical protein
MSKTTHYHLDYLDPHQLTSQDILMDGRRFTTIDNNLYALFKIFGNGIIVLESTEFPLYVETFTDSNITKQITVTAGRAFVNYKSINYITPTVLNLPEQVGTSTSQKYYLYLKDTSLTPETELGEFFFSSTKLDIADNYIGLGAVQIDYSNSLTQFFDDSNNGRQIISVKKLFISFINSHVHTGGLGNPPRVDLSSEVTGLLLPGAISFVDASKIRGGQLSQYVAPQVDHNKLYNTGNLSHSQIDSAVLSNRDSLNLEVVASLNQLKVIASIIRTTAELASFSPTSGSYPSGSIATIDTGLSNVFVYCPNIASDRFLVGYSGAIGNTVPNALTNCSGPFTSVAASKLSRINRTWNTVNIGAASVPSTNAQSILTFQKLLPYQKAQQYGQSGYFAGFVPGIDFVPNSGSSHMVHVFVGQSGTSMGVNENYEVYNLTLKNKYNSALTYGMSGVQLACLSTNLNDFAPSHIYNANNYSHLLYSSDSTGPRILSPNYNGYLRDTTAQDFFTTTGPVGAARSFYYETTTGPKAILFSNGNIIANLGASDYMLSSLGSGKFSNVNSKISLGEFSSTALKITELGPTGPIQQVSITSNGTNITNSAISDFEDESAYRIFYIDNDRLYLATPSLITEMGYFANVIDLIVKYNRLFIITLEDGVQKLYHAYEAGYPTVFNQILLNIATPSSSSLDVFQDHIGNIFISVVSNSIYYVFDLDGKEIFKYQPGAKSGSGPLIRSVYTQFDLGDATIDLKYG